MSHGAWSNGYVLSAALAATAALSGCVAPECADPDYREPECRVLVENELAALRAPDGVDVRFVDPAAPDGEAWVAAGLVTRAGPTEVHARVAAPGAFALQVNGAGPLTLVLDNVDPAATVVARFGGQELPVAHEAGLRRRVALDLSPETSVEIRGSRACPARFRLAAVSDLHGNLEQAGRILRRLAEERAAAEAAGEALVGLVLLGDLSPDGAIEGLAAVRAALDGSPVPAAAGIGNHDAVDGDVPAYNRVFGPGNYAFSVCDARVAQLDTGSGGLAPSVEARLPELLDRGAARFHLVGTHMPPYAGRTGGGWASERQAERLLVEAAIQGSDAVLAGHVHAILSYPAIPVGDAYVRELVVGTGGGDQGAAASRFGYLRLRFGEAMEACFVEVPPAGGEPLPRPPEGVPRCVDP